MLEGVQCAQPYDLRISYFLIHCHLRNKLLPLSRRNVLRRH